MTSEYLLYIRILEAHSVRFIGVSWPIDRLYLAYYLALGRDMYQGLKFEVSVHIPSCQVLK